MDTETFERLWRLVREPNCPGSRDYTYQHVGGAATLEREWRYTTARRAVEKAVTLSSSLSLLGEHRDAEVEVRCIKRGAGGWIVQAAVTLRDILVLTMEQRRELFPAEERRCRCGALIESNTVRCPSCAYENVVALRGEEG